MAGDLDAQRRVADQGQLHPQDLGDFAPGGTIDISYKDQELETAFAKRLGVPLLLANLTQQVYQMARAQGLNKQDGSAIVKIFEQMAGVTVKGD